MNKFAAKPTQGKIRSAFTLNPVAAGCAVFVSAMASSAFAQTAPASGPAADATVQSVTVTGIRRGIEAAIDVKKNASSIVETISAEDIGKLPDTTIAESLARLPGLTAQRTKSGTASGISIRGLGPDFNGYLLNGREQTSTGDSRAVDLSAYPAELIAGATVYKTSDASLMSAGLAGTIDQQLIDPLAFGKRVITGSYEKIKNGVGLEVEGRGDRASLTYVDQFMDRKIGVALGFVRVDGSSSQVEKGNWGDATVAATGPNGENLGQVKVPGFGGGISQQTNDITDKRTGVAAILAFKPNKDFNTQLDLFYSKMDIGKKINAVKAGLGRPITNATVSGGVATAGTFALPAGNGGLINYIENVFDEDEIKSLGWKTNLKLSDTWRASFDVNHNTATRVERDIEYYAGIATADTLSFATSGDSTKFTLGNPSAYTNPATIQIRDQGWSGINGVAQAGYNKGPNITDKVDAIRLDLKHELADGSMFTNVQFGVNYSKRSKDRSTDEGLIISEGNNGFGRIPFPTNTSVYSNAGGSGLDMLTFEPQVGLIPGAVIQRKYNNDILSKTWNVEEKVSTAYAKLNLDTAVAGIPVTGNVGVQLVHTNQASDGYRAGAGDAPTLENPSQGGGVSRAGISYTDVLPSLNLTGDFGDNKYLRLGVSQQIARPTLTDMRNSFAASVGTDASNVGTIGRFNGSAGNPALKPFKAKAFDLSAEKYFGKRGYVSAAVFYKKLDTYITTTTNTAYDYSSVAGDLGLSMPPGGPIGIYTSPVNGGGGSLKGYELTASAPFDLITPWLSGFGANGSFSHTSSSVRLPDSTGLKPTDPIPANSGLEMPLPGLSKKNAKLTVYYEKNGFSFFVAKNYRSDYVGSVANDAVGGYPTLRYIEGSSWVSAQIGYEFQTGALKGLGFRVQGNNLNAPIYRQLRADGSEFSTSETGKTIMFKVSYKM